MTHPDDIGYDRAEARQQAADDGIQYHDDDWYDAMDDLAGMDLEDQFDALMDAAIDERFALPAWEEARERAREAMPVPAGLGGMPW